MEPTDLGDEVVHYSIPSVDATGTGQIEDSESIKSAKFRLSGGEVLISKLNPRKSRVVSVAASTLPIVSSTEFVGLRAGDALNSRYLAYLLQSDFVRQELDARVQSVTRSHQRVAPEDITHLNVAVAPLAEQRRIADFLDAETARIDQLVGLQVTLRARLDERDDALRDNLVNELAKTVGEVPLRRFTTRIEQGTSPQCEAVPRQGDDEWGVLKLSAVKGGHFIASENKRLPEETEAISAYQVRRGDLLVTRANTPSLVGDVAVIEGDHQKLLLPDLIYRVGLVPEMNADFVAQVALSGRVRTLIESVARGSSQSMVKLRGEDIKTWPVPMATQTQQDVLVQEIRSGMQGTGRLRTAVARQLSLLAERRQSLITAAVTGQFDVSTASGRNVTDGVSA
ncbi:hypothetical protein [Streptomyces sp. P17]|uniref:hypothetical protein n=1 Tax=Streptomyces sp. P17 TaxID=3074716 RepID=UPI0028F443EE|nr:hypothetical protein [Streptomyces sp. P17]MDT9697161.1 hypothetical protein [Streptomyces sp. P17]